MKYLNHILSGLLGLVFVVFGLNFFLNFMPMPPMEGDAAAFMGILFTTKFLMAVKVMEILFGAMILANFKRPLGLILIAPIVVGILMFELFIAHAPGVAVVLFLINACESR